MRKSLSGYITGRPVVYPVVRLRNRSIAGHPYGTYTRNNELYSSPMHDHTVKNMEVVAVVLPGGGTDMGHCPV